MKLRRGWALLVLVGFSAALAGQAASENDDGTNPAVVCSPDHVLQQVRVDGYEFRVYGGELWKYEHPACLEVYRDKQMVYRLADGVAASYSLGQPADRGTRIPGIPNGTDVTGSGHQEMIVTWFSGGMKCCYRQYIFELEPKFRLIASIEYGSHVDAYFKRLSDNQYYFILRNYGFLDWPSCDACSPKAHLILRIADDGQDGSFKLAWDKMAKPAPPEEQLRREARAIRRLFREERRGDEAADPLWETVLKLIYSGHSERAWKFVGEAIPGKDDFLNLELFCSVLKDDQFWPQIEPTLKNISDECAKAKPLSEK